MQALIERIRSIFLEMGFSEIVDDYVQTAGWNMDSLFIPQDHPAREMQDTFYLDEPKSIKINPELLAHGRQFTSMVEILNQLDGVENLVRRLAKGLLRTHTTVNTIQYLADNPKKPCRVFAIDRVFRKESIDRTTYPSSTRLKESSWNLAPT